MAWVEPKLNWDRAIDRFNFDDYNIIKGNVAYLYQLIFPYHIKAYDIDIAVGNTGVFSTNVENIPQDRVYQFDVIVTGDNTNYTESYSYVTGDEGQKTYEVTATDENLNMQVWFTNRPIDVQYFDLEDMGSDKAVNAYWYADEWNTILDNIRLISEKTGARIAEMPVYYPNGSTPTDNELNIIEKNCLVIYNRIIGYTLYLGTGYTGGRVTNVLL